jgi:hypothetical protein
MSENTRVPNDFGTLKTSRDMAHSTDQGDQ